MRVLSNKRIAESVYSSAYGNTVRNGHETVPTHCLHCTALNENGNFFLSATVLVYSSVLFARELLLLGTVYMCYNTCIIYTLYMHVHVHVHV